MLIYRKSKFYFKNVGVSLLYFGIWVYFKFLNVFWLFILFVLWFISLSIFILWYKIYNICSYNFMKEYYILLIVKGKNLIWILEWKEFLCIIEFNNVCINWVKIFYVFIFNFCVCILILVNFFNLWVFVNWCRVGLCGNMIGIFVWCDF